MKNYFRIRGPGTIYAYSIVIGIVAGLLAVGFSALVNLSESAVSTFASGVSPGNWSLFSGTSVGAFSGIGLAVVLFLPAFGGLCSGIITHFLCPQAAGSGTDALIRAFHHEEGRIAAKVPVVKSIATLFTISSGGSAGKEGPTMQIGGGIGSALADAIGAGARARRTLMLAGTAAGLSAIFQAPFGAALTAAESLYKEDIESDSLIPCFLSSVTAYLTGRIFLGDRPILFVQNLSFQNYAEIPFYLILGLVCWLSGKMFVELFRFLGGSFSRLKVHPVLKPALGGLIVGLIGLFFPEAIGVGFRHLQSWVSGRMPLENGSALLTAGAFIAIAILKMVSTSFTVGSGGSGGVFGPSLFIGGAVGGAVGCAAMWLFPEIGISVPAFILVGMAAFFSGAASAPLAGMVMVCDMVGSYSLLPALMVASIIAFLTRRKRTLYPSQLQNRFESPAHYWDMDLDVLSRMQIRDMLFALRKKAVVKSGDLLSEIQDRAPEMQASDFIVLDGEGRYFGMLSLKKVRLSFLDQAARFLITAGDAADGAFPPLDPDQTLSAAMRLMTEKETDKAPVVHEGIFLGYIKHSQILEEYYRKIEKSGSGK